MSGKHDEELGIIADMLVDLETVKAAAHTALRSVKDALKAMVGPKGEGEYLLGCTESGERLLSRWNYGALCTYREHRWQVLDSRDDLEQCSITLCRLIDEFYPMMESDLKRLQQQFLEAGVGDE